MWTLGFDSTASTVSAAILKDKSPVAVYSAESSTSHSTTLLPAIEKLLFAAGITADKLDLISCSAGPGSFTGVRIGIATAKGLAAPFGIPCVGVSSLEAMAYLFCEIPCYVCPALDARRGNVYAALFHSDGKGNVTRITEDDLVPVNEMADFIKKHINESVKNATIYFAGDSVMKLREACSEITGVSATPALLTSPSGYGVALSGLKKFESSNCDTSLFTEAALLPIYLRKSQAERERDEKNANL